LRALSIGVRRGRITSVIAESFDLLQHRTDEAASPLGLGATVLAFHGFEISSLELR
jgi:hypothetical protein